jgi:glycine/serine hydroxymethyltransferase
MSPLVSSISSDLGNRYTSIDKFYKGTKFIDEIEKYGEKIKKKFLKLLTFDHFQDM